MEGPMQKTGFGHWTVNTAHAGVLIYNKREKEVNDEWTRDLYDLISFEQKKQKKHTIVPCSSAFDKWALFHGELNLMVDIINKHVWIQPIAKCFPHFYTFTWKLYSFILPLL